MRIGEVARRTGIPASAIRYYEDQGIIECPERDNNGYRRYAEASVNKLLLIRAAQRLGFSLQAICSLFQRDGSCSMSMTVTQINLRLEELAGIEASLQVQRDELLTLRKTLEASIKTGTEPLLERDYKLSP